MQIVNALLRGQAFLIGVFLRIWGGLVGDSGLIVIVGGAFLFANGLRIARAMVTTLNARGVRASCRSVDRTRVHTSINKQRLLKSNQWELLLKSFCDAFDFDAANILTRRITIILRCSKLLKRCKMRLLVTLIDILFHVCLWLKLLLFEVLLGTIKLMVLVIRQKHVLITGLAACSACLEKSVLLLDLVDSADLLADDTIRAHTVIFGIVAIRTPILIILAAHCVILLMWLMHQLLRIDRMLIHNLHGIISNLLVALGHV